MNQLRNHKNFQNELLSENQVQKKVHLNLLCQMLKMKSNQNKQGAFENLKRSNKLDIQKVDRLYNLD